MQLKRLTLGFAGGLLLMLGPAAYAADTPPDVTASPAPETMAAPAEATAPAAATAPAESTVTAPADAAASQQPQVAAETPVDARASAAEQQMAADPCAGSSPSGSMSCEKLKRKVSADKTAKAGTTLVCTSHMDAKGTVIYDDPTCPSRMGGPVVSDPNRVYLIRENPFFNLHIDKATEHARAAEIAGNQGQAIEMMDHAQMSLLQAKEAQRAGNVPGLNEGIISLREA
jgi:pyruvate/2-oxoglutarate dehydrogenase complex dihydrolipoamide acyltransferase (E2) component